MWIVETAAVAFGLYSALPMPHIEWNEKNTRYALAAFPLVGAALALAWWGWTALCQALALPTLLRGAILCVLPTLVTGGIHLDGYADTHDALASRAAPAHRQEILRDPHCGAFAVIRLCVYFVVFFALCCAWEPTERGLRCAGLGFVLSRSLSGLALTILPIAEGSSLAKTFASAAVKGRARAILGAETALCAAALCLLGGAAGSAAVAAAALVLAHYAQVAKRGFGGTSGDLAGWFLVKTEFWMLAALFAVQSVEKML